MELFVTVPEVVPLIDNFTDTISFPFQTRSPIQISILKVIP